MNRSLLTAALLVPALCFAQIGKVSLLEGKASRAACQDEKGEKCGALSDLKLGDAINVKEVVVVGTEGNIKITLNDETVIKLAKNSRFFFQEAQFNDQNQREGFAGSLSFGKFWANVKKAVSGSDQKFQVSSGRAVAGVRGTIFRVDATPVVARSTGKSKAGTAELPKKVRTVVMVTEGIVGVNADIKKVAPPAPKGKRVQVQGPTEISADEWEKKFVELQKGMMVVVDDGAGFEAKPIDPALEKDDFSSFVDKQ